MKAIQTFSDEYLEQCKRMTPNQIVRFLDDFRQLHSKTTTAKSKLISIKIPVDLLQTFRRKSELSGTAYQTQIKKLMKAWVLDSKS